MNFWQISLAVVACGVLSACADARYHKQAVADDAASNLSVGVVQSQIKKGMPSAEVVAILGSPNMVTSDGNGGEVWVYDRISTEAAVSGGSIGGGLLGGVVGGSAGALGGLSGGTGAAAMSKSQKNLTVIIKFDQQGAVSDVSYRQSKF